MRRWGLLVLVVLLVVAGLAGFKFMQIKSAMDFVASLPEPSASVEAATAEVETLTQSTSVLGEVVAPQELMLTNELEGRVTAVNFVSGQTVEAGQVLLKQDIAAEAAQLEAAQARVELARVDLNRARQLLAKRTVSEERVDQAQADYDIATANVEELQAVISKKILRAPFAAVAGLHTINVGEFLQANTPIVSLVGVQNEVWVDFTLPMGLSHVSVGTEVTLQTASGERMQGRVIARDAVVSSSSRNLRLRSQFAAHPELLANSAVKVSVPVAEKSQVSVPATAVLHDTMGDYVYRLVKEDESGGYRARRQQVEVGVRQPDRVGLVSGLEAGELIATQGSFKLSAGLRVWLRDAPAHEYGSSTVGSSQL